VRRHGGNGSLNERCRELQKGLVDSVGPLRCRRGCRLSELRGKARQKSARGWWAKQDEGQPLPKVQGAVGGCRGVATGSRPPRREEDKNRSDLSGEGAAVVADDAGTAVVGLWGESARWLRRSGLMKVRHHDRSICVKSDGWRWGERGREDLLCHL
jgi:hypothetical protein